MAEADQRTACPDCGKAYPWRTDLARRKVRCVCGTKFRIPAGPDLDPEVLEPSPEAAPADREMSGADDFDEPAASEELEVVGDGPPVGEGAVVDEIGDAGPPGAGDGPDEADAQDDAYALDLDFDGLEGVEPAGEDSSPVEVPDRCPECTEPTAADAVICINCGFNFRTGERADTAVVEEEEEDEPLTERERRKLERQREADEEMRRKVLWGNWVFPLSAIGLGLLMLAIEVFVLTPREDAAIAAAWGAQGQTTSATTSQGASGQAASGAQATGGGRATGSSSTWFIRLAQLGAMLVFVIVQLPLAFVAVLLIVKLFGVAFEGLVPLVLKLAGIVTFSSGLYQCVATVINTAADGLGFIIASIPWGIWFATFAALSAWMLELDYIETSIFTTLNLLIVIISTFVAFVVLFNAYF